MSIVFVIIFINTLSAITSSFAPGRHYAMCSPLRTALSIFLMIESPLIFGLSSPSVVTQYLLSYLPLEYPVYHYMLHILPPSSFLLVLVLSLSLTDCVADISLVSYLILYRLTT